MILTALVCHADTITWTNTAGGSFQDPLNWSPNSVPDMNDTALFSATNAPYTVTWEENVTNHTQIVRAGTVTFDLKGYTYSLDKFSTNTIGTTASTAITTYTNGTVRRRDVAYASFNERLFLRGPGSTLSLRNAKHQNVAYYHSAAQDTRIIVDGPDATFTAFGYSTQTAGHIIVTNGGYFSADASLIFTSTSEMHVSGPGSSCFFSINNSGMPAGALIVIDNGAVFTYGYGATNKPVSVAGTITLDDARMYEVYGQQNRAWLSFNDAALLQGRGSVEMPRIIMNGGTIRPGCADQVGLLSFTGHITNAVPTSVLDMELGGSTTNDYDRIRLLAHAQRGSGMLYAGGILNVTAINGYEPERPTTFNLIDAVEIVPAFDTVNLPDWVGEWDTSELYTAGTITFYPQFGTTIVIR